MSKLLISAVVPQLFLSSHPNALAVDCPFGCSLSSLLLLLLLLLLPLLLLRIRIRPVASLYIPCTVKTHFSSFLSLSFYLL